ncbi:leucine-rich repeat-containing protein [Tanacetum coccineum]|uniref:Leucine-rich repeat-containing protein n=1 Tax=Tanacetum coccineum TaxID=301880 RepID=A0ABQ5GH96_9ASTR
MSIGSLTKLTELQLGVNNFSGAIPSSIGSLTRLTYLNLDYNSFSGTIPPEFGNLTSLLKLSLVSIGSCTIDNLDWLSRLSYLNSLKLDENSLAKANNWSCKQSLRFPKWIPNLKKSLLYLDLSQESISDTISIEYWNKWNPSQLHYLDLSFNRISGILPDLLSNLTLYSVDLSSNSFYGSIPAFPAGITFLNLSRNKFSSGISFLCQVYERFEFLDLSRNRLTGQLPDCLCTLTELKVLNLGHNILSGRLPPSLGCLGQLETLSLYNNTFFGELPVSLKNCAMLSFIDLGANKFFGNVPVWIGENLSRLYVLSLRSNNFYGTTPLQICHLETLQILDLSINKLHGTIPSCVKNFTGMAQKGSFVKPNVHHYQWLPHYALTGDYVEPFDNSYIDRLAIEWQGKVNEFGSTLGLVKTIDLSSNNSQDKSRKIPSTMSKMDRLNDLDVSYNNLSGRIPSSTQLQSFPSEWFAGNSELCGLPTMKKCLGDERSRKYPPLCDSEVMGIAQMNFENGFYIEGPLVLQLHFG